MEQHDDIRLTCGLTLCRSVCSRGFSPAVEAQPDVGGVIAGQPGARLVLLGCDTDNS